MTINYYLVGHNEEKRISLYLFIGGKRKSINTGFKIYPKYWDKRKQRVRKSFTGSVELNRTLDFIAERVRTTYSNFKANGEPISKLIEHIEHIVKPESKATNDFFEVLENYIKIKRETVSKNTIDHFVSLRNHLRDLSKVSKKKIEFENIDLKFHDSFVLYLQNEKNHSINTIANYTKKLKS